ncbi:hypothetical protein [Streptomyces cinereoruber]|uniref:hypothetical protein n=1 Tax=Streptomyces cinereoruber TaxID=67260 RepID=UPI00362CCAA8
MSVLTHTRPTAPLAYYEHLTPVQQHGFDTAMEDADDAGDASTYNTAMYIAGLATIPTDILPIGVALTATSEIAKCACLSCYCTAIFDTASPGLIVVETTAYGLVLHQCADCADDHPTPVED